MTDSASKIKFQLAISYLAKIQVPKLSSINSMFVVKTFKKKIVLTTNKKKLKIKTRAADPDTPRYLPKKKRQKKVKKGIIKISEM